MILSSKQTKNPMFANQIFYEVHYVVGRRRKLVLISLTFLNYKIVKLNILHPYRHMMHGHKALVLSISFCLFHYQLFSLLSLVVKSQKCTHCLKYKIGCIFEAINFAGLIYVWPHLPQHGEVIRGIFAY